MRNSLGGFTGTQDTVIGLEALAAYTRDISNPNNNVELKIHVNNTEDRTLKLNNENRLILQTIDLPSNTESVSISASGHGFALFQLSYRYNVKQNDVHDSFTLRPKVLESTAGYLNLQICTIYEEKKLGFFESIKNFFSKEKTYSNMVLLEVEMHSGFLTEKEQLDGLLENPYVKLVETTNGETVVNIYFNQMLANEEICVVVKGYRSHKVTENKPVPVRIYDYYDSCRCSFFQTT